MALPQVSKHTNCSAKGAEYESQGQREAKRSASPLEDNQSSSPALLRNKTRKSNDFNNGGSRLVPRI